VIREFKVNTPVLCLPGRYYGIGREKRPNRRGLTQILATLKRSAQDTDAAFEPNRPLENWAECLQIDLARAKEGIRVKCLAPGWIATPSPQSTETVGT